MNSFTFGIRHKNWAILLPYIKACFHFVHLEDELYHLFLVDISLDSFSLYIRIVGELALVPLLAESLLEKLAEH
jgi:hypothetical protein